MQLIITLLIYQLLINLFTLICPENLVEGKRKRAISHSPASHQASPGRRKGGLAAAVLSCEEVPDTEDCPVNNTSRGRGKTKSRGGKRLLPQLEPQATSTPTPKRQRQITEEISHTSGDNTKKYFYTVQGWHDILIN